MAVKEKNKGDAWLSQSPDLILIVCLILSMTAKETNPLLYYCLKQSTNVRLSLFCQANLKCTVSVCLMFRIGQALMTKMKL